MKNNKNILEKKKLDEFKEEIKEKENKINKLNDNLQIKQKEIEDLNLKMNEMIEVTKYNKLKQEKEELDIKI